MKFKDVFGYIGDAGIYQVLLVMDLSLFTFFNGIHNLSSNFFTAPIDHWCEIPRLQNFSFDTQKNVAIPYKDGEEGVYDECKMYDLSYGNLTDEEILLWDREALANSTPVMDCSGGWVFDRSQFVSTIATKYGLVCGKQYLAELTSTIYMAGNFFGSFVSGIISDRYGRKIPLMVSALGFLVFSFLQAVAPNYAAFVIFRFFVSFCNRHTSLCNYVLRIEVLGPRHLEKVMMFSSILGSAGIMVGAGIGYAIRDMETMLVVMSLPILCFIPLLWAAPESPRWLVSQGRYEEANAILKKIAVVNGKTFPDDVTWDSSEKAVKGKCADICTSSILRSDLALVYFDWFTVALVYYGVSFNAGSFGDVFLNTFLSGLIEIPANIICYICLAYWGRRWPNGAALLFTGFFSLACVPVLLTRPDMQGLLTAFSTIGKGGITFAFTSAYLYTSELFPTPVRHLALGTASMVGRVGSMASPFLGRSLEDIWKPMPSVIFGVLATITGCVVFLLPETKGRPIPDTIRAAEDMRRHKTNKHLKESPDENTNVDNGKVNLSFDQKDEVYSTKTKDVTAVTRF